MTTDINIPKELKHFEVVSGARLFGNTYKAVPLAVGKVRINRHTRKYLLGDTLFDLGKIILSPKEVIEPKVHVHAVYEMPEGLDLDILQGEPMSEENFLHTRFYVSEQVAGWAFNELRSGRGTLQTLRPSFAGRNATEMKEFLIKNYVHPKSTSKRTV